jgi:membrane-bound lytic murein transglycosylase B
VLCRLIVLLAVAVALVPARADSTVQPPAADRFDLTRPEIKTFIDDVVRRNSLKRRDVSKLLAKAEPQPRIIELITRPAERVTPWWEYRDRFVNEERVALGAQLWQDHREELERIAAERGVPPEYIVAIIGVETKYGRITGRFRVLDALATLAFDYPPRSDFFRKELEEFLLLSREESMDPLKTLGSYAGAMGNAQFMPSSYRRYAVDAQDDRRRDLWQDWGDVFASIANYFREHGWETGAPVIAEVDLDPDPTFTIDARNLTLNATLESLASQGVEARTDAPATTPAMLIFAQQSDGPGYRVGFRNFEVITKYNRSPRYAMAVHDLAQAIAARMRESAPVPPPVPVAEPESQESTSAGTAENPQTPESTMRAPPVEEPASPVTPPQNLPISEPTP